MTAWESAEIWLATLKASQRCAPPGLKWHRFYEWLADAAPHATTKPPPPLILAASAESAANKHRALGRQLRWAHDHGVLTAALARLELLDPSTWDTTAPSCWDKSYYPTDDSPDEDE